MIYLSFVDLSLNNGQGRYAFEILKQLQLYSVGEEITVLIPSTKFDLNIKPSKNMRFIYLPQKKERSLFRHFINQLYIVLYLFILRKHHSKIVFSLKPMAFSTLFLKLLKYRVVLLVEGDVNRTLNRLVHGYKLKLGHYILKKNLNLADLIIPAYSKAKHWCESNLKHNIQIKQIRCGVNYSSISIINHSNQSNSIKIGYVGSFNQRHCLNLLVEAVSLNETIQVLLIGDGPTRDHILQLIDKFSVSDRITWVGEVPNYKLSEVLSSCTHGWGVTSNKDWSVPIKVYEYLAMGITPIFKECIDFHFITENKLGYALKANYDLYDIVVLFNNLKLHKNDKNFMRKTVCKYCNWSFFAHEIYDFFKSS